MSVMEIGKEWVACVNEEETWRQLKNGITLTW